MQQHYYDMINEIIKFVIQYNTEKTPIFPGSLLSDMWTSSKNKRSMIDVHLSVWNPWAWKPEIYSLGISICFVKYT